MQKYNCGLENPNYEYSYLWIAHYKTTPAQQHLSYKAGAS